jgi:monovalent cation/proton antiporter MnhG/PhaG subunit
MSAWLHDLMLALYAAGLAVVVLAPLAALRVRHVYNRLHFVTPMTSLGAPLIGLALAIQNGWGLTTAQELLIVGVLAVTGPVLAAATGRLAAQRDGLIKRESPQ